MRNITLILLSAFLLEACYASRTVTVASLLDEMTDLYCPTEFPEFVSYVTSSHDRRSTSPGTPEWFANEDGFGYERLDTVDGRVEKVLFEDYNPGAVTRIWITTNIPKSTIRFYFDGDDVPGWIMDSYDFTDFGLACLEGSPLVSVHPNYEKGVKGGQTFFLPIPYAKSCRITLEEPKGWSGIPRYYQIEHRSYPEGTPIETFCVRDIHKYVKAINKASAALASQIKPEGVVKSADRKLYPGEILGLEASVGERAVTELTIHIDGFSQAEYAQVMRGVILRATFDGEQTVNVPLGDFSGAGLGAFPVESRQLYADGNGLVRSFWIMPYRKSAYFELQNTSEIAINSDLSCRTKRHEFTDNTLYFHSSWNASEALPVSADPLENSDWDFTALKGMGVYCGDNLTVFNHSRAWYGEGDDKIYVDGEAFPSFFGTGTEDYYNCSWAPVHVFHTPWGGAPRADLKSSRGYNTFFRTRLCDVIPFKESFDFDLELISWVPGTVDIATTAYWYGAAGAVAEVSIDPALHPYILPEAPEDPSKFFVAGSYEAETLDDVTTTGELKIDVQDMSGFPDGKWSMSKQLTFFAGSDGDSADFRVNGLEDGRYSLVLYLTKAADYGMVDVVSGGRTLKKGLDCYFPSVVNSGAIEIGEIAVSDGKAEFSIVLAGQNSESRGNLLGVDCIVLEKIE